MFRSQREQEEQEQRQQRCRFVVWRVVRAHTTVRQRRRSRESRTHTCWTTKTMPHGRQRDPAVRTAAPQWFAAGEEDDREYPGPGWMGLTAGKVAERSPSPQNAVESPAMQRVTAATTLNSVGLPRFGEALETAARVNGGRRQQQAHPVAVCWGRGRGQVRRS